MSTTITGNIKDLSASAVPGSRQTFVRFWLRGSNGAQPRVNGTAIIAPSRGLSYYFDLTPNSSGVVSGTLYSTRDSSGTGNGDIEVGGSLTAVWYGIQCYNNGTPGPEIPVHANSGAIIDISNITPITVTPVVTAPTGDGTYIRLDQGNGPYSLTAVKKLDSIRFADQFSGGSSTGGIQEAINDLPTNGGIVVLPAGATSVGANTVNVTKAVVLLGCGGNGASSVNYTGGGTLFNVSANLGFKAEDFIVTGTASPAFNFAAGGASGQTYILQNINCAAAEGVVAGASTPFVIVRDCHFRCTQFDVSIGAATDALIDNCFFDSAAITSAQGHILLASGSANIEVRGCTLDGTNTTIPDITVTTTGGDTTANLRIHHNKFGAEVVGAAAARILFHYTGAGTATVSGINISDNFGSNGAVALPDFVKADSNSISFIDCHFDRNAITGGPGTGYIVDLQASPPASQLLNTAWGNSFAPGNFLNAVHNPVGFMMWSESDASGNGMARISGYVSLEPTTTGAATRDTFLSRAGAGQLAIGTSATIGNAGGFLAATGINLNHTANTGFDFGFNFTGRANLGSTASLSWGSTTAASSADTGLGRGSAGVVTVDTGTIGNAAGSLLLAQVTEQTANGAQWIHGQASELLTLSTSGTTTDTSANLLPANSIIESVVARVTTTITTATNWELGDATQAARFSSPSSSLTAGSTVVGLNQADPTVASSNLGPVQTSAAKVRVTTTGTPGAGAIRITVFYRQFVAPTS